MNASGLNTCFDKVQREAANAKRELHGAAPLAGDDATGQALQTKLDALATSTWNKGEADLPA